MQILILTLSFALGIVKIIGTAIGLICAFWHASTIKNCEKPLSKEAKKILKKPLFIGGIAGFIVTVCLIARSMYLGQTFLQAILSIGAYKILIVPLFWALIRFYPSKRGREIKKRTILNKPIKKPLLK